MVGLKSWQDTEDYRQQLAIEGEYLEQLKMTALSKGLSVTLGNIRMGRYSPEVFLIDARPPIGRNPKKKRISAPELTEVLELAKKYGDTGWFPKTEVEKFINKGSGEVVESAMFDMWVVPTSNGSYRARKTEDMSPSSWASREQHRKKEILRIGSSKNLVQLLPNEGGGVSDTYFISAGYNGMIAFATLKEEIGPPQLVSSVKHIYPEQTLEEDQNVYLKAEDVIIDGRKSVKVEASSAKGGSTIYQCFWPRQIFTKNLSSLEGIFLREVTRKLR